MDSLSYDVFFEKIAANPLSPILNFFKKKAIPAAANAAAKQPTTIGKIMGVALPVTFMGMEGMNALSKNRQAAGSGPAINLPQTMNPWRTF